MTPTEFQRRMHRRPLRDLTEHELDVLDRLEGSARVFNDHIASGLISLGALAMFEINEREHEAELARQKGERT